MYKNLGSEFEFLYMDLTGTIDSFYGLAVFIVHFNERGRANLSYNVNVNEIRSERKTRGTSK